eukprot:TRINITY_DN38262_c0_g1_i1.p1 TRINITY_DN38262_c0_g1~~TRINITY_DN38262_c0_g1_i1.p1  ORF type:complete len:1058 (-),score=311.58 TRINITY_DN38262_c0_g1_i1:116-3289(-)
MAGRVCAPAILLPILLSCLPWLGCARLQEELPQRLARLVPVIPACRPLIEEPAVEAVDGNASNNRSNTSNATERLSGLALVEASVQCLLSEFYPAQHSEELIEARLEEGDVATASPGGGARRSQYPHGSQGHVLPQGASTLLQEVSALGAPLGPEDKFVSLGSVLGHLVLQVYLSSDVGRAVGIEAGAKLDQVARSVGQAALGLGPMVYGLGTDRKLYAQPFDTMTQETAWAKVSAGKMDTITAHDKHLFGVASDRRVYRQRLSSLSSASAWEVISRGSVQQVAFWNDFIYGAGSDQQVWRQVLSNMTLRTDWELIGRGNIASIAIYGDIIYAVGSGGLVYKQSLPSMDFETTWEPASAGVVERITIFRESIYGVASDSRLWKQELKTMTPDTAWLPVSKGNIIAATVTPRGVMTKGGADWLGEGADAAAGKSQSLAFRNADPLGSVSSWSDATVLHLASLRFDTATMLALGWEIAAKMQPGTVVFSERAFPGCQPGLLKVRTTAPVATSWAAAAGKRLTVYVITPHTGHPLQPAWLLREAPFADAVLKQVTADMARQKPAPKEAASADAAPPNEGPAAETEKKKAGKSDEAEEAQPKEGQEAAIADAEPPKQPPAAESDAQKPAKSDEAVEEGAQPAKAGQEAAAADATSEAALPAAADSEQPGAAGGGKEEAVAAAEAQPKQPAVQVPPAPQNATVPAVAAAVEAAGEEAAQRVPIAAWLAAASQTWQPAREVPLRRLLRAAAIVRNVSLDLAADSTDIDLVEFISRERLMPRSEEEPLALPSGNSTTRHLLGASACAWEAFKERVLLLGEVEAELQAEAAEAAAEAVREAARQEAEAKKAPKGKQQPPPAKEPPPAAQAAAAAPPKELKPPTISKLEDERLDPSAVLQRFGDKVSASVSDGIMATDSEGRSVFWQAAGSEDEGLASKALTLLLQKLASEGKAAGLINAADSHRVRPLERAVRRGHIVVAKTLLQAKADARGGEDGDAARRRPLHHAALLGHLNISKLLIEYRARIDDVDEDGSVPWQMAPLGNMALRQLLGEKVEMPAAGAKTK